MVFIFLVRKVILLFLWNMVEMMWVSVMIYWKWFMFFELMKILKGWCCLCGVLVLSMMLLMVMYRVCLNSGDLILKVELMSCLGCLMFLCIWMILVCLGLGLVVLGVVVGVVVGVVLFLGLMMV